MNKRLLAAAWALAALLPAPGAAAGVDACPGCNIILVSIDTLSPSRLGCYGGPRKITSPNLDALAARGTLFENFTLQSHLTPISMASVLTSLYPHRSGYINFLSEVPAGVRTLPEVMKIFGYRTAAFSSSPEFSSFYWKSQKMEPFFERGFDQMRPPATPRRADLPAIKAWLGANKDSKFFLWLAAGDVHWPYAVHADSATKALFGAEPYSGPMTNLNWWTGLGRVYQGAYYPLPEPGKDRPAPVALSAADLQHILNLYDAGIYTFDQVLGAVAAELEKLGLAKKTLLVVHTVHGDETGKRGYYGHSDIYDSEVRGALVLNGPGIPKGLRVKGQVSGLDIMPTVLDLAGIPPLYQAQGQSLLPVAAGKAAASEEYIFSYRRSFWERQWFPGLPPIVKDGYVELLDQAAREGWDGSVFDVSVTAGGWRLIHRNSAKYVPLISWWGFVTGLKMPEPPEYELYNTAADPGETVNLAGKEPDRLRELLEKIREFEAEAGVAPLRSLALNPEGVQPYP